MKAQKVYTFVSNDLVSDQRLHRVCTTLQKEYEVILVGVLKSKVGPRKYKTIQFKLPFAKGSLFYAFLNLRIFFFLLFRKCEIVIANDADTLLACALASKIKSFKLFYDAHENFTEVPELSGRNRVKRIWQKIEAFGVKNAIDCYTVTSAVAKALKAKYQRDFKVIRNLPSLKKEKTSKTIHQPLKIIYQGVINKDRGIKEVLPILAPENIVWDLYGAGDEWDEVNTLAASFENIQLKGRVALEDLAQYTSQYDIGLSVEKISNINYKESLPNKVLDYIQSGLPVIFTPMDEVVALNEQYQFGICIHEYSEIVDAISKIQENYSFYHENALKAAQTLNWEQEEAKLLHLLSRS